MSIVHVLKKFNKTVLSWFNKKGFNVVRDKMSPSFILFGLSSANMTIKCISNCFDLYFKLRVPIKSTRCMWMRTYRLCCASYIGTIRCNLNLLQGPQTYLYDLLLLLPIIQSYHRSH